MGIALSLSGVIVMLAFYLFLYVNKKDENELLDQRRVIEEFPTVISSLGVFFTFCGIAYGLYKFDESNLDISVPVLLDGMQTAFFTSVVGMFFSVILKLQINYRYDKIKSADKKSLDREMLAAVNKMVSNTDGLKDAIESNSTKIITEAMTQITEAFRNEMSLVSKEMQNVVNKLVQENFEELNASVGNMISWQKDNKEMISELTDNYKIAVKNFEDSSAALKDMAESTKELVKEDGDLANIVFALKEVMIDDERFKEIVSNLATAAHYAKKNQDEWRDTILRLNDWLQKQKGFYECVNALIVKLDEINKQRDFNEQFWQQTRAGMNAGVNIISKASTKLKEDLEEIDRAFYDRLNQTLSELDNCIRTIINRR